MEENQVLDFTVNVDEDREIRILQLTDFQAIDISQQRYEGRLNVKGEFTREEKDTRLFNYIDKVVKMTTPDLIIVTGDNVYGEFDDNGENMKELCAFMDAYRIPWAPVFGNHDNESKMGVTWQCEQFEKSEYCLFKRRELTGNGNYNIGITRKGKLVKVIYMLDSNGTYNAYTYSYKPDYPAYNQDEKVQTEAGIYPDQVEWIDQSCKKIEEVYGKVSKFCACHIAPEEVGWQAYLNGYQSLPENWERTPYTIGVDVPAKNGDFGRKGESLCTCKTNGLWGVLQKHGFDGFFVGHCHVNNLSVLCGTVRVTYGVKTGSFDYHDKMGGTLILLSDKEDAFTIEPKFVE